MTLFAERRSKGINYVFWLPFPCSLLCPILSSEIPGSFLGERDLHHNSALGLCSLSATQMHFLSFEKSHKIDAVPTVVPVFALSAVYI